MNRQELTHTVIHIYANCYVCAPNVDL